MHARDLTLWRHSHRYETGHERRSEHRTRIVVALTVAMMVIEIGAGTIFNSMALLADGWHMSTHAGALGIAALAYMFARRHADDRRFTFGTAKIGSLAAFASAIALGFVSLFIVWESANRLIVATPIAFSEAIPIAVIGLAVNLISAWLLGGSHAHDGHDGEHGHHHGDRVHHDQNLRAAYIHVVADAFTSVLAIAALLLGKFAGWTWMDPIMGIVGALVIANWSYGLLSQSGRTLLDWSDDRGLEGEIRDAIEGDSDNKIVDLHLWKVGPVHHAAIVSLVTHHVRPSEHYKRLLRDVHELSHVTVEVSQCAHPTEACAPLKG